MVVSFVVEEAGCESCARLVRAALEPLGVLESVEIDEGADLAAVRLSPHGGIAEDDVQRALDAVSASGGHAYRVRAGSWST